MWICLWISFIKKILWFSLNMKARYYTSSEDTLILLGESHVSIYLCIFVNIQIQYMCILAPPQELPVWQLFRLIKDGGCGSVFGHHASKKILWCSLEMKALLLLSLFLFFPLVFYTFHVF